MAGEHGPGDVGALRRLLDGERAGLAAVAAERTLARLPRLLVRLGDQARPETTRRASTLLAHLQVAIETERPELFDNHVRWAVGVKAAPALDEVEVATLVEIVGEVLVDRVGAASAQAATARVAAARRAIETAAIVDPQGLDTTTSYGRLAAALLDALIEGDRAHGTSLLAAAIRDDTSVQRLAREVITPCLREVGRRWQHGQLSVAQEHLVTSSVQLIMAQLPRRPRTVPPNGRRVLVTAVGGELHEIGARMVADAFEAHGWTTDLLGADTPTDALTAYVQSVRPDVVALSATIPAHLLTLRRAIPMLRAVHDGPILVGGQAFTDLDELWKQLGADGTAPDGDAAVAVAEDLVAA